MTYIDGFVAAVPTANNRKLLGEELRRRKAMSLYVELSAAKVHRVLG